MPEVQIGEVTLSYGLSGPDGGDAVVLICGCGQPAVAFEIGLAPALATAGFRVVTFDNRGVAPSSSPPAPYSIADMVGDTIGLFDDLGLESAYVAGYSMGGWIAETMAIEYSDRVRAAAFLGSCNLGTAWEKAITTVERDLARLDYDLPRLFYATETLRYLPNKELQDDEVVTSWLSMIADIPPWPNPGRLGQYEASLAWSNDVDRIQKWSGITVPCLVLAFEEDVDSPPAHARQAASGIPGARFEEIPGVSHLAPITHSQQVADSLVGFFESV